MTSLDEKLNQTIDTWLTELDRYNNDQLLAKPSPKSWSIGELYMHLILATEYYIEQVRTCINTNENCDKGPSEKAKRMFLNNDFPNEVIEGPPSNKDTPQPRNKEEIRNGLTKLKAEISSIGKEISRNNPKGRTKHFDLDYFNVNDWLQFAEMHLRHHFRQKKRIDDFLGLG